MRQYATERYNLASHTVGIKVHVSQQSKLLSLDAIPSVEQPNTSIALYSDLNNYPNQLVTKLDNLPPNETSNFEVVNYEVVSDVMLQPGDYWILFEFMNSGTVYSSYFSGTNFLNIENGEISLLDTTFPPNGTIGSNYTYYLGLTLDCTASASDFELNNLSIYPNPAQDFIQVNGLREATNNSIYNVLGSKVKQGKVDANQAINTSELASGVYILNLNNSQNIKFVKK